AAGANIVAITQIAMDHQEYLGHTLSEITAEKAAIIRPGVTAIIAPQDPNALDVIRQRCASVGVSPRLVESTASGSVPRLGMRGRHQATNAATAVAIAAALGERGFQISRE